MESKKYYTPEIEEFHVGFEYEVKKAFMTDWDKRIFFSRLHDPTHIANASCEIYEVEKEIKESVGRYNRNTGEVIYINESIRVKYLNRYDIEGCDFKYDYSFHEFTKSTNTSVYNKTLKYRGDEAVLIIIHNTVSNWVCIAWSSPSGACYQSEKMYDKLSVPIVSIHISNTIFAGTIKNKSELKVVLKQIINE